MVQVYLFTLWWAASKKLPLETTGSMLAELEPPGLAKKKVFGGVAFTLRGNLACGTQKIFAEFNGGNWNQMR